MTSPWPSLSAAASCMDWTRVEVLLSWPLFLLLVRRRVHVELN